MAISGTAAVASMFSRRFTNIRNVIGSFNSSTTISSILSRNWSIVDRSYSVDINSLIDTSEDETKPKKKMSKAMKAYLQRAKEYDEFMKKETTEYQIGKRHLANMMGENPETFTQDDVNKSIAYLFPSGLYEKRARPIMEMPENIFPPRKAAQFDDTGRPYHSLFYTCRPNYYQTLHDIVGNLYSLNTIEDTEMKKGVVPHPDNKINLVGTQWFSKPEFEEFLLESISEEDYEKFIATGDRLTEHPYAFCVKDFILKFRRRLLVQSEGLSLPEFKYTPEGRPYITVKDCKRKSARATVTVFGKGTGKITINGKDISYFWDIQSREQVIFPLIFTKMDDQVDVEANVINGGFTGQSGAVRFGISWALRNFVEKDMIEKMRIAGLLTMDARRKERKKPGQAGARKKFTWKKR